MSARNGYWTTVRRELPGVTAVAAVALIALVYLTAGGILTGQDAAAQFYPWYGYLGEQLRLGQIPEWNPSQFAGAPFAADPQSGWMYLPAMLLFTFLPRLAAIVAFLAFHLLLAGIGTWALARLVGIGRLGSAFAAIAYMGSGVILGRLPCCPASYELATWVPVCLVGVEITVRSGDWRGRVVGWSLTGVALSQVLAVWLGQGAYYVLVLTGAYLGYRCLVDPAVPSRKLARWRDRCALLGVNGVVVLALGFGLAAAGVLPRLEYNAVSNVAGGVYRGSGATEARIGGASSDAVISRIFEPSLYYPGAVTLALAVAAVVLMRRRHATLFWLGLAAVTIVLAMPVTTPLHWLFYLLPRFEELHSHWPERAVLITYLAPAMLAGSLVSSLGQARPPWRTCAAAALPLVFLAGFMALGATTAIVVPLVVGMTSLLVLVSGRGSRMVARKAFPLALLLLLGADIAMATRGLAQDAPFGGYHRLDLSSYYDADGAARFLQNEAANGDAFRFAGYDPSLVFFEDGEPVLYRYQFAAPRARSLLVNNAATALGLEDIQGYNPIQLARYVDYVTVMNGVSQEYHGADVYPTGLDSPLLDLLNLRYLVVPARNDLPTSLSDWEIVYADAEVYVLQNPDALERGWIVHDVRPAHADALASLAAGTVDPRQTALVEGPVPPVSQSGGGGTDDVDIIRSDDPDIVRLRVRTKEAGFLVLSEIAYPAWRATVNGAPVPLSVTNGTLRGLPVPAGDHMVELQLDSAAMRWGIAISVATFGLMLGAAVLACLPYRRAARSTQSS